MTPLLRLEAISRSYWRGPRELRVLRGVSLEVAAGEFAGVYGARGVGKTTLLRIAAGFEQPDAGRVLYDDEDVRTLSRRRRARLHRDEIAWVERSGPQSRELPMRDYVALPLYGTLGPAAAQRRALVALARAGAEDAADERWTSLSDTSRALVALAHAFVRRPRLLLLDDPAGGLNVVERERVLGLLRDAAEEARCGVLMTVPDLPAMSHVHTVRALSRGRLLTPAERPQGSGTVVAFPGGERSA